LRRLRHDEFERDGFISVGAKGMYKINPYRHASFKKARCSMVRDLDVLIISNSGLSKEKLSLGSKYFFERIIKYTI
jgi:hypothetical protein